MIADIRGTKIVENCLLNEGRAFATIIINFWMFSTGISRNRTERNFALFRNVLTVHSIVFPLYHNTSYIKRLPHSSLNGDCLPISTYSLFLILNFYFFIYDWASFQE
jgi:hypothetical protein